VEGVDDEEEAEEDDEEEEYKEIDGGDGEEGDGGGDGVGDEYRAGGDCDFVRLRRIRRKLASHMRDLVQNLSVIAMLRRRTRRRRRRRRKTRGEEDKGCVTLCS
jgi:hypothetical protein